MIGPIFGVLGLWSWFFNKYSSLSTQFEKCYNFLYRIISLMLLDTLWFSYNILLMMLSAFCMYCFTIFTFSVPFSDKFIIHKSKPRSSIFIRKTTFNITMT